MNWRKSWAYENIYGKNGNGDCSKRQLLPDERSVWDDYLDLGALNIVPGQISISPVNGYTSEQLAGLLKTPREVIERTNKKLQQMGNILIENNGIIIILNWKNYQTEWERTRGYTENPTQEPTQIPTVKPTPQNRIDKNRVDKIYIRKEYKHIYTHLLSHWNNKKIIVHKYLDSYTYGRINSKLDHDFTEDEIKKAIDNYAHILKSKAYFWTKEWTLGEFLQRGFDKFLDFEGAKKRYVCREKDAIEEEIAKFRKEK